MKRGNGISGRFGRLDGAGPDTAGIALLASKSTHESLYSQIIAR